MASERTEAEASIASLAVYLMPEILTLRAIEGIWAVAGQGPKFEKIKSHFQLSVKTY